MRLRSTGFEANISCEASLPTPPHALHKPPPPPTMYYRFVHLYFKTQVFRLLSATYSLVKKLVREISLACTVY